MTTIKEKLISLRLPEYYHKALKKEAAKRDRSLNYLLNEIIVQFVKNLENK